MVAATTPFSAWLTEAQLCEARLNAEQRVLLQAVFRFRQQQGNDYYCTRILSHFLLHCDCGLKVAQIARLVGVSRPTASRQQGLSSKQVIQQAHHRLDGRPYGKLLPRYAGAIAQFLLSQANATRADLCDFIDRTFGVRVSRIALYKFLKKYGLDGVAAAAPPTGPATPASAATPPPEPPPPSGHTPATPAAAPTATTPAPMATLPVLPQTASAATPATRSAPPFCSDTPSMPVPS